MEERERRQANLRSIFPILSQYVYGDVHGVPPRLLRGDPGAECMMSTKANREVDMTTKPQYYREFVSIRKGSYVDFVCIVIVQRISWGRCIHQCACGRILPRVLQGQVLRRPRVGFQLDTRRNHCWPSLTT